MDVDAFILIGGRSSRFGSDKAFAELEGKMLAVRAAETVEKALSPKTLRFVVASDGQFGADLIFRLGRPVVADLKPGFGAWSGLHTALAYSSTEWTFVLACDLPFVSEDFMSRLSQLIDETIDAVIPRQPDGRLQPLCAFYRRSAVLPAVDTYLGEGGKLPGLTDLFATVNAKIIGPEEFADLPKNRDLFTNINSRDDLRLEIASNLTEVSE